MSEINELEIPDEVFEEKAPGVIVEMFAEQEDEESPWLFARIFRKEEIQDVLHVLRHPFDHRELGTVPALTVFLFSLIAESFLIQDLTVRAMQIGMGEDFVYFMKNSAGKNVYGALAAMGFGWKSWLDAAIAVILVQVISGCVWHWGEGRNHEEDIRNGLCVLIDMLPFTLIGIVSAHISAVLLILTLLFRTYCVLYCIFTKKELGHFLRIILFLGYGMIQIFIFISTFLNFL